MFSSYKRQQIILFDQIMANPYIILFKYIFSDQKSVDVNLVLALDRMAKPGPNPWDVKRSSSLIHTNFGQPAPGTFKKYQRSLILKHNAIQQEVTFSSLLPAQINTNLMNESVSIFGLLLR